MYSYTNEISAAAAQQAWQNSIRFTESKATAKKIEEKIGLNKKYICEGVHRLISKNRFLPFLLWMSGEKCNGQGCYSDLNMHGRQYPILSIISLFYIKKRNNIPYG
jgi:hypothetical protein